MPISHSVSATIIGAWFAIGVPVPASANVIAVVMPPEAIILSCASW